MSLLRGRSLTEGYFSDARLARTLRRWSETVRFDAVLTFSSCAAPYAECVDAARRVLDMNDVDSFKWKTYAERALPPLSWLYALEGRRLAAAEAQWSAASDAVLLVNDRERRKAESWAGWSPLAVARTGVDLARYAALGMSGATGTLSAEPIVGMLGSMSYAPNERAVNGFGRRVWPEVKRLLPGARWLIVGSRPGRRVRRWHNPPDVAVTGYVEDVRPYLRAMRVFAAAVDGAIGVQTKLIEAMATGRPAVVTPAAAAGLDYGPEPPFLVAETPEQYAQCVLRLLRDDRLAERLAQRARRVVEANYRVEEQVLVVERWLEGDVEAPKSGGWRAETGETASVWEAVQA